MYKKAQSSSELVLVPFGSTRVDRRSVRLFLPSSPSRNKEERTCRLVSKARVLLVTSHEHVRGLVNFNPSVTSAIDTANGRVYPLPVFIPRKYVPVGLFINVGRVVVLVVMVRREFPTLLPGLEFHSSGPQLSL